MLVCHLRVLQLLIEFGGGTEAQDAAHSTSAAYSDGGRPQKKSMGKAKKSSLTDKHIRITIWSLTST